MTAVSDLDRRTRRGNCLACGLSQRLRGDGTVEAHRPPDDRQDLATSHGKCRGAEVRSPRLVDETGNRYGQWLVLGLAPDTRWSKRWLCRCDCGAEGALLIAKLRKNLHVCKSCDPRYHGRTETATYRLWSGMLRRCFKPYCKAYPHYGGRGITVCERWLVFANFYADMGDRPEGKSLDRIDNDGPYSPENCRWATDIEQHRNRRDNRLVTFQGRTEPLARWAEILEIPYQTLHSRVFHGWPVERAFTEPVRRPVRQAA